MNVQTSLGSGTSTTQGTFIEMFLTAQLIFTILMLAVEKHRATPLAPVGIGGALSLGHFIGMHSSVSPIFGPQNIVLISPPGINWTGASLNPARSFGPAVILGNFLPEQWIYWLGPILGAVVAVGFYKLIRFLEYESANPGQDDDGLPYYRIVASQKTAVPRRSDSFSSLSPFGKSGGA